MMFGFSPYVLIGSAIAMIFAVSVAGYKGYQFGADRQRVVCEQRINSMQAEIDKRNAEIKKIAEEARVKYDKLLEENEAAIKRAEDQESMANVAIGAYEDEIARRTDKCILTDADIIRLQ